MDERLVIPKEMRDNMLSAIHFRHAGRDAMLREAADVWLLCIHCGILEKAKSCQQCCQSGKILKCLQTQSKFGKLPKRESPNEEISLDFAGSFQIAENIKKFILVSVDNNTGLPDAMFLPDPTADKIIEVLKEYISINGIPNGIRTYPGTVFKSHKVNHICKELCLEQVVCPVRDHRGNRKDDQNHR